MINENKGTESRNCSDLSCQADVVVDKFEESISSKPSFSGRRLAPIDAPTEISVGLSGDETQTSGASNSWLWRLKNGDMKVSWVLGTIHIIPRKLSSSLNSDVLNAIQNSDCVVLEVDQKEGKEALEMSVINNKMGLSKLLKSELLTRIDSEIKKTSEYLDVSIFEKFPIGYFSIILPRLQYGLLGTHSMEQQVNDVATDLKKKMNYLDSPDFQLSLIESLPLESKIKIIEVALEKMKKARERDQGPYDALYNAYLSGDINRLKEFNDYDEVEGFKDKFFTERDKTMFQKMISMISGDPKVSYLFAVGAGHLVLEGNILERFRNEGYIVERVTAEN